MNTMDITDMNIPAYFKSTGEGRKPGDLMAVVDLLGSLKPVKVKKHTTWVCKPHLWTKVFAKESDRTVSWCCDAPLGTTAQQKWVILRPDGTLDVVSGYLLNRHYSFADRPSCSTSSTSERASTILVCDKKDVFFDWEKVESKPIKDDLYAVQIPLNVTGICTDDGVWAINSSPANHGKGDFLVVRRTSDFVTYLPYMRVMTPAEFANRFDLRGWEKGIPEADRISLDKPRKSLYSVVGINTRIQKSLETIAKEYASGASVPLLTVPKEYPDILAKLEGIYREKFAVDMYGLYGYLQQQGRMVFKTLKKLSKEGYFSFLTIMSKEAFAFTANTDEKASLPTKLPNGVVCPRYTLRIGYTIKAIPTPFSLVYKLTLNERGALYDSWQVECFGNTVILASCVNQAVGGLTPLSLLVSKRAEKEFEEVLCKSLDSCLPQLKSKVNKAIDTEFIPIKIK